MSVKKIFQMGLRVILGAASLLCFSVGQAQSLNFTISDSYIQVGESFDVSFSSTFDSDLQLAFFAFDVDPLGALETNGTISFIDWSVPEPLSESSFGPPEVGALGDPFDPLWGGSEVLLGTLSFTALGVGTEYTSLRGLLDDEQGFSLFQESTDLFFNSDIDTGFNVTVNAVPEPPLYGMVPVLVLSWFVFRRKRRVVRD